MSWAAERRTARVEDVAYSLLGLFGIDLLLIYGEGEKAFWRTVRGVLEHDLPAKMGIEARGIKITFGFVWAAKLGFCDPYNHLG